MRRAFPLLVLASAVAACGKAPSRVPPSANVVARVGGQEISAEDVAAEARATGQTVETALETLIRLELIAQAAAGSGVVDAAAEREMRKSAMVHAYLQRHFEPAAAIERMPDEPTRRLYENARERFVHGRLVEVGLLAILTGDRMNEAPRLERESYGKALYEVVRARGLRTADQFQELAREPDWKAKYVHYRRLHLAVDTPYCRELGEAAQRLTRAGDQTGLVICPDGAFVATYLGEKPPENRSYESARDELRAAIWQQWRKQYFLQHNLSIAAGLRVEELRDRLTAATPHQP